MQEHHSKIAQNEQGRAYNRSEQSERATTPTTAKKPCKGQNGAKRKMVRCIVCGKWFYPDSKNQKICSDSCRADKRRQFDQERYRKSVGEKPKAKTTSSILKPENERKLTHKGQLKQVFNSAKDALASLTTEEIAHVERVMALPYDRRWDGGARDWTEAQRVLARKIELKRIAFDAKALEEEDAVRDRLYQSAQTDQSESDEDDYGDDETNDNN